MANKFSAEGCKPFETFFQAIADRALRPVFLVEHLAELLAHKNNSVINRRLDFLAQLPSVATFKRQSDGTLGSIASLWAYEAEFAVSNGRAPTREDLSGIIAENIILQTESGDTPWLLDFIEEARRSSIKRRRDVSIIRMPPLVDPKETVFSFFSRGRRSAGDREKQFAKLAAIAEINAERRGDKRISDPKEVGLYMLQSLREMSEQIGDRMTLEQVTQLQNIPSDYVKPKTTISEFLRLGWVGGHSKVLADHTGLPQIRLFEAVECGFCPTFNVLEGLEQHRDMGQRSSGGAIIDRNFISCSRYIDLVYADAQSNDCVRRAKKSNQFAASVGRVKATTGMSGVLADCLC